MNLLHVITSIDPIDGLCHILRGMIPELGKLEIKSEVVVNRADGVFFSSEAGLLLARTYLGNEMKAEVALRTNEIFTKSFSIGPAAQKLSTDSISPRTTRSRNDKP